jgi:hypothetical protein
MYRCGLLLEQAHCKMCYQIFFFAKKSDKNGKRGKTIKNTKI